MPRAKRRERYEIDYGKVEPREIGVELSGRLIEIVGLDPIDPNDASQIDSLREEIGWLMAVYPKWEQQFDKGPGPANYRVELGDILGHSRKLLQSIDCLTNEVRDLLVHDPEYPSVDVAALRANLLSLVLRAKDQFDRFSESQRGKQGPWTKRRLVWELSDVFRIYAPLGESRTEEAKNEFVRTVLNELGIQFKEAHLRTLLSKLPLGEECWPSDP